MPRPKKRVAAGRQGGINSVAARKRQRLELGSSQAPETSHEPQSEMEAQGFETDSDAPSDGELSEEEDKYPIGQPEVGWEAAERALHGYSKTRVTRQKKSYHKNKEDIKRRREEKKNLNAGIPVIQRPKPVWGNISTFFSPKVQPSVSPPPEESSQHSQFLSTPEPTSPSNWESLTLMAPLDQGSLEQSLVRPYIPPNFDDAFLNCQSFQKEASELEIWLKNQKGKVTGDWLMRVECLKDLLQMQHRNIVTEEEARRKDWVQYSEALSRRVKRSPRWAAILRKWARDWFETRSPPPCPRRGRHVKRKSLFFDEGIVLAVREYLNVAMWHASPKGLCEAVANHLQSVNAAVDIMRIDAVLRNSQTGRKGISERTAIRWLARLGWVFGRNKKGYCDGHERPDVVEYRENVFCPRMKVSSTAYACKGNVVD